MAAMPARYVIERSAWAEAGDLQVNPTQWGYADAMTHFARAIGLARAGKPDEAQADVEALKALVAKLEKDAYWREQVDIQRQSAEAWIAFARGQHDEALNMMRTAADSEAKTDKHPITPGPLSPAREQLGEMLMVKNRPGEALVEFEAVQHTDPNRLRSIIGAAKAAEASGDLDKARRHYAHAVEVGAKADATRTEIAAAKAFVAKN
jgi:tetratricopeptide (TPR) repeat protein